MSTVRNFGECKTNRFGLLNSVQIEEPTNKSWQADGKLKFVAPGCNGAEFFPIDCVVDYGEDGKPSDSIQYVDACVFETIYGLSCPTSVIGSQTNLEAEARNLYLCKEGKAVESAIWSYFDGTSECLDPATPACPEALAAADAVAVVEDSLNDCCGQPYIFVPSGAINYLNCCNVITENEDGQLTTLLGSVIIPIKGANIGGAVDATTIYGVNDLRIFRGDLRKTPDSDNIVDAVDLGSNMLTIRFERSWGFGINPCCGVYSQDAKFC